MGNPYTSVTVSNYNANPPSDDGAATAANRVQWSTEKTKLTDPLKTAFEASETATVAAFAKIIGGGGVTATAISYTVTAGDQGKLVKATASGITITTPDATVVTSPFVFGVLNNSSGDITLDGSGSQTINGSASLTMAANDGWLLWTDGTNWFVTGRKTGILPRGYIDGCIISNGTDATNDINIAAGVCRDSTNAVDITVAAMTKQLDANWAVGTNAGMRNSAIGIADTTYHIYAVATAAGVQDIYAHTSATVATVLTALQAESGGASYVYARHIMSIVRLSSVIRPFTQRGDTVVLTTPLLEVNNTADHTTAQTVALTACPTGVVVEVILRVGANDQGSIGFSGSLVSPLTTTDLAPGTDTGFTVQGNNTTSFNYTDNIRIFTNASAQIRYVSSAAAVDTKILLVGWIHPRGVNL